MTAAMALVCLYTGLPPAVVCISGGLAVTVLFTIYTHRRYKSIARLNDYLQRLAHGEKALDIRDNAEGELSILKNEIYKVTIAQAEQAETLSRDKLELANALADISHQLKTPLTAIGVMVDLLSDENLTDEKRQEFVDNIRASQNRMEWLVLTLLKMARLDAGAVELKPEPVLLSKLVERALLPLLIPIELKEQNVTVTGNDASVACNPEWTAEALSNIIKNAVENTPMNGHIRVEYGVNPLYTYITVRDGGPGVDKADLPYLFKRFYRGKNASRESAGIGLSMSLAVMRKQNGDIEVTNDNGGVFTLKFFRTAKSDKSVTESFTE